MILLVEDNPGDIALFQIALRATAARCTVSRNAGEAIAALTQDREGYQVVVVDLRLCGADGWVVLDYLRDHPGPGAKVILTSSTNDGDRARASAYGDVQYMAKPDDFASLQRIVQEIAALDAGAAR